MMKYLRIAIVSLIVLIFAVFIILTIGKNPQEMLLDLLQEWNSNSIWLLLAIFGFSTLSTLTGLPVNYLSVALGFFFAYIPALGFSIAINLIAVMASFFMVRRMFSNYFQERHGSKRLVKSINKRIHQYKYWTVAFSRGIYIIPTNIINFSFPLSKITGKTYLLGTLIGLIPECLINITIGYLLKNQVLLLDDPKTNLLKIITIGLLLVFSGAVLAFLYYRKKRRDSLKDIVPLLDDDD